MNTRLLEVVKQIMEAYGPEVLDNSKRVGSLFADLAKDEPRPHKTAFIACLAEGFHKQLAEVDREDRAAFREKLAQRLNEDEGLDITLCGETLDLLAAALFGEIPEPPPRKVPETPSAPSVPPQRPPQPPSVAAPPPQRPFQPPPTPRYSAGGVHDVPKRKKSFLWVGVLAAAGFILILALNSHDPPEPENYSEANRAEPLFNEGREHFERHEYTRAIALFTDALEFNPNHAGALAYRGGSYRYRDQYDAAIEDCTAALDLDPGHFEAYYYRGTAYYLRAQNNWSREDLDRGIADLDEAMRINPNHRGARYNLGLAYDLAWRF